MLPAITQLLAELEQDLQTLEAEVQPTWTGLVEPLEQLGDRLSWSWGIIGHLMGVKNSPELREAYEAGQPKVVEFINRLSQSRPIYNAYKQLQQSPDWSQLDPASSASWRVPFGMQSCQEWVSLEKQKSGSIKFS